jgi:hypothetical protein
VLEPALIAPKLSRPRTFFPYPTISFMAGVWGLAAPPPPPTSPPDPETAGRGMNELEKAVKWTECRDLIGSTPPPAHSLGVKFHFQEFCIFPAPPMGNIFSRRIKH